MKRIVTASALLALLGGSWLVLSLLGGRLGLNLGSKTGTPVVAYDWSTFTENKKLSEDFTRVVKEVFEPGHTENNPFRLKMRQEVFAEIGYLGIQEMTINLLHGFKSSSYIGFSLKRSDGTVVDDWTVNQGEYRFPMVVVFSPDGSLIVKTNGLEKQYDYATSKEDLKSQFAQVLYSALSRAFEKTPKYREQKLQEKRAAEENEARRLEQAKKSWE